MQALIMDQFFKHTQFSLPCFLSVAPLLSLTLLSFPVSISVFLILFLFYLPVNRSLHIPVSVSRCLSISHVLSSLYVPISPTPVCPFTPFPGPGLTQGSLQPLLQTLSLYLLLDALLPHPEVRHGGQKN